MNVKEKIAGVVNKWAGTSTITRDNHGNITGARNGYSSEYTLSNPDVYLSAFRSVYASKNFVTLFHTMSELQFPILAIVDRALNASFYLKDYDTDSPVTNNKQVNKFLTEPNSLQDFKEFMSQLIAYLLITGDSYLFTPIPDTLSFMDRLKASTNFWVLPADCILPEYPYNVQMYTNTPKEQLITDYRMISGMGNMVFPTKNVLHFKELNLVFDHWTLKGRSKLQALEYVMSNLVAVYEARNVIYVKRGALGAIVNAKSDSAGTVALTSKEKKNLQDQFNDSYGLEKDKGQYVLSDVPLDFIRFNMSIQELEPFKETLNDAIAIAGLFGVPSVLVPRDDTMSSINNGSADAADKSLYLNTVIPLVNHLLSKINSFLGLREAPGSQYIYADFSKIQCLQENKKDEATTDNLKATTAILKYSQGLITYNMMLVQSGEEKVAGGDYYVWNDPNRDKVSQINMNLHAGVQPAQQNDNSQKK